MPSGCSVENGFMVRGMNRSRGPGKEGITSIPTGGRWLRPEWSQGDGKRKGTHFRGGAQHLLCKDNSYSVRLWNPPRVVLSLPEDMLIDLRERLRETLM